MRIARPQLTMLLNRLYDREERVLTVDHPSAELGTLLEIELDAHDASRIRFVTRRADYEEGSQTIRQRYDEAVYEDLPSFDVYLKTLLSGGILELANRADIESLLTRYGDPDLLAGHAPVLAGFDTNLLPWRIDRVLGLTDPGAGIGYVNGFVLTTGVRDELEWEYKCHDTGPFETAYDRRFDAYWNQSLGSARRGRLGLEAYRRIRDIEQAVEVQSEDGDAPIIAAYDEYNQEYRSDLLLFSNDRNFVERAKAHRILGQRVEFPRSLPRTTTASWREIEQLLYQLAVVFGIIELPGVTLYGVWSGKEGLDWRYERLRVDARSPVVEAGLETDMAIVEAYQDHRTA